MDKYDKAIKYLTKYPHEIWIAWGNPNHHNAGCLFAYCDHNPKNHNYGCLTQVKSGQAISCDTELTNEIFNDERIPDNENDITVDNLHVFAEWQRKVDEKLNRR